MHLASDAENGGPELRRSARNDRDGFNERWTPRKTALIHVVPEPVSLDPDPVIERTCVR